MVVAGWSPWAGRPSEPAPSGRCLDDSDRGLRTVAPCQGQIYQQWTVGPLTGTFPQHRTVVNAKTHRCLDSNSAGHAYSLACNGGPNQQWHFDHYVGGAILVNHATGLCLDDSDRYGLRTYGCEHPPLSFQLWY